MDSKDGDDSLDSFFNQTDFGFAKNEEKLERKNSMMINIFQEVILQGTDINGYILLQVSTKLPEGKIFLRIDCEGETHLDKTKESITADESIQKLKNRLNPKPEGDTFKSAIYTLKKFSLAHSASKSDGIGQKRRSVNHRKTQTQTKSRIEKEPPIKDGIKNASKLALLEWEVFKLEKSIEKAVYLFLPFRISLDNQVCVTTDQVFSASMEALEEKTGLKNSKLPPITEYGSFIAKLRHDHKMEDNGNLTDKDKEVHTENSPRINEKYECVKLGSKITAYYVTNTTYAEFGSAPKATRFELFSQNENFCSASKQLNILANYKRLNFKNWKESILVKLANVRYEIIRDITPKTEPVPKNNVKSTNLQKIDSASSKTIVDMRVTAETMKDMPPHKPKSHTSINKSKPGFLERTFSGCAKIFRKLKKPVQHAQRVSLSIDRIAFNNDDTCMNFVLHFKSDMLHTYKNVDVLVWANNEYKAESQTVSINRIFIHETYPLLGRIPKLMMPMNEDMRDNGGCQIIDGKQVSDTMEFVGKLHIGNLTANFQTIVSPIYKMIFYVEFYMSKDPLALDLRLFTRELNLIKLPEEFVLFDSEYNSNIYVGLEKNIYEGNIQHKSVMLPYTHIVVGEKYGDELKDDREEVLQYNFGSVAKVKEMD